MELLPVKSESTEVLGSRVTGSHVHHRTPRAAQHTQTQVEWSGEAISVAQLGAGVSAMEY